MKNFEKEFDNRFLTKHTDNGLCCGSDFCDDNCYKVKAKKVKQFCLDWFDKELKKQKEECGKLLDDLNDRCAEQNKINLDKYEEEVLEKEREKELYRPEDILQAMSSVLMREGKIYMDLVLIELKQNYRKEKV